LSTSLPTIIPSPRKAIRTGTPNLELNLLENTAAINKKENNKSTNSTPETKPILLISHGVYEF